MHRLDRVRPRDDLPAHHAWQLDETDRFLAFDSRDHARLDRVDQLAVNGLFRCSAKRQDQFRLVLMIFDFRGETVQEQDRQHHRVADDHAADRNDVLCRGRRDVKADQDALRQHFHKD